MTIGKRVNVHLRDYSRFLLLLNAQKESLQPATPKKTAKNSNTCQPKQRVPAIFSESKKRIRKKLGTNLCSEEHLGDQNLYSRTPNRIQRSCLHEISPHQTFSEWRIGGFGPGGLDIWGEPDSNPKLPGPTGTWMSQEVLVKRLF